MSRIKLLLLIPLLLVEFGPARADSMVTEVIPAGFRDVQELVPIIRPLVPKPGSVSGISGQLIIKTSPENMRELKAVLATLDRAPANLLISVRHDADEEVRRDIAEAFGEIGDDSTRISTGRTAGGAREGLSITHRGGGHEAGVRVLRTHSARDTRDEQRVRVLEGREAFIQTGQSVPVADQTVIITGAATLQQGVRYADVTRGFYVRARLTGEHVTLEIAPQRNTLSPSGGGNFDIRQAATVVSGQLGRWIEIAGVSETAQRHSGEQLRTTRSRRTDEYAVYIRVERL